MIFLSNSLARDVPGSKEDGIENDKESEDEHEDD
jgi:hypothetical protein